MWSSYRSTNGLSSFPYPHISKEIKLPSPTVWKKFVECLFKTGVWASLLHWFYSPAVSAPFALWYMYVLSSAICFLVWNFIFPCYSVCVRFCTAIVLCVNLKLLAVETFSYVYVGSSNDSPHLVPCYTHHCLQI